MPVLNRARLSVACVAVGVLTLSACTSSPTPSASDSGSATSTTSSSATTTDTASASPSDTAAASGPGDGTDQNINNEGTPVTGGTLNMLGIGDVDYMDPNVTYYSAGYTGARLWARQLVTFPAIAGKATTSVPDLATELATAANGGISADGLTYTYTIRDGVKWDTTPARQVTGDDLIRGVKRSCNPAQPFGGLPSILPLIEGFSAFCDGFTKVDPKSASAIADYQNTNAVSGLKAQGNKIIFKLTHPAPYFESMLALPAFSAAPVEYDKFIPASAELAQATISDGPYSVEKYEATKVLNFKRNPAWDPATDKVRKAYVDRVEITMTGKQEVIQQQLEADTPDADMEWDTFPPVTEVGRLIDSKDPNFYLGATFSSNPYVIFNTVSPNNSNALGKVAVRQALSRAINRDHLIQDANGPDVSPPLTHVLPKGISGTTSNVEPDLYPYDVAKAKTDLAAAGVADGTVLKMLYRPESSSSAKMFATLQQDLAEVGIKVEPVAASNADFYVKYLQVPDQAKKGVWDISLAGWGPDWYGDAALSFFAPLFQGDKAYPPVGSNFGLYNNPDVSTMIAKAAAEPDPTKSAALWKAIDQKVMEDAPFFPITTNGQPVYHSPHVHNTVFIPTYQQNDPANVWLSK
ncbi:MAG: transporter substrate-binding protein [Frankiales bacterium]|nr:transporter substrate-binding protein [Frankiales bacterium]